MCVNMCDSDAKTYFSLPTGMTGIENKEDEVTEMMATPGLITDPIGPKHPSVTVAFTLKVRLPFSFVLFKIGGSSGESCLFCHQAVCDTLGKLPKGDLKTVKTFLWKRYPQTFSTPPQHTDILDLVDRLLECFDLEGTLQITENVLTEIGLKSAAAYLQMLRIRSKKSPLQECKNEHELKY